MFLFLWVVKERSFALSMFFADSTRNFDQKRSTAETFLFWDVTFFLLPKSKLFYVSALDSSINILEILKDINADTPWCCL